MTGAGSLDRRVTFQRATVAANGFNEPVETWAELTTVYTYRRDASAAEAYRAQEVGADISSRFKVRYSELLADLNPRDRLIWAGRIYNITAVREVQRLRWIEVDAVAGAAIEAAPSSP